jgi:hypothetical protein
MTGGYDEWAVARTPSLLAFAAALAEDDRAADAAVARALARVRARWPRVAREHPDLEARHHVVRACSTPRRAAVVLRVLEKRSDPEIAAVLRCSTATARRHLDRGLASESVAGVRAQLVARAGAAPTQLLTRDPETTTSSARARPHGPWLAALAVLVLVGGVAFVAHESRAPNGEIGYPSVPVPPSWRYESYAGVQVQVPDTWGWGSSPVRSSIFDGRRHLGACGTNQAAVLSPTDDSSYVSSLTRFVGRPAVTNQRCVPWGSDGVMPVGEAVWFGSPLAVGVTSTGGNLAETRAVGEQHVTVFGRDASLRRQILGTAEEVDVDANGCPTRAVMTPTTGPRSLDPRSLSTCVYSQDTGVATLLYSGALPQGSAEGYVVHVDDAMTDGAADCPTPSGQWVALGVHGGDGTRWDILNLGCARIQAAGGQFVGLSQTTLRDWAVGGVTAYVGVPRGGDRVLDEYLGAPTG